MRDEVLVGLEQKVFQHIGKNPGLVFRFVEDDFVSAHGKRMLKVLKKYGEHEWSPEKIFFWFAEEGAELHREVVEELFGDPEVDDSDFESLREVMRREAAKRNMREILTDDISRLLDSKDEIDTRVIERSITELSKGLMLIENGGKFRVYNSETMMAEYEKIVERRKIEKGFWDTGCSNLNSMLQEGFAPQKITSIYASSGMGKSSYALYLVNRQINCRIPAIYITLEMDMSSTIDRLIGMRHKVPLKLFYGRGQEDRHENFQLISSLVEKEKKVLSGNPFFRIVDQPGLSIADIEAIVEQAKREMGVNYLICTIDLLSMVKDFNHGNESTADRYEHALNSLHEVARRTNCHFVGVFQSRRNNIPVNKEEDVDKLRPKIEQIKNSGAVEERSRIIISLFRKRFFMERYFPGSPTLDTLPDIMEVKIDKQNMGSLGVAQYWFEPQSSFLCKYEAPPEIRPFVETPVISDDQGQLMDTNSL